MYLLDTNVVSELMRPRPHSAVVSWLDVRSAAELWVSAVTVADIWLGIQLISDAGRRAQLAEAVEAVFEDDFEDRCLPFDALAAVHYAAIVSHRTASGRPISVEEAQIAAIARSCDLTVVTRNMRDFAGTAVGLVNPFE
ncbi:MAG: type II toxin-antitoxin system VapC family toxin [Burkholderiales bacterium]|nr:MAG: type II toxin-antitoxin system VapC family toxin [Burkholderiales bacterium]